MKEQNAHLGAFVHCPLGCCRQRVYYKKNKLSVMRRKLTRVEVQTKKDIGQLIEVVNNYELELDTVMIIKYNNKHSYKQMNDFFVKLFQLQQLCHKTIIHFPRENYNYKYNSYAQTTYIVQKLIYVYFKDTLLSPHHGLSISSKVM